MHGGAVPCGALTVLIRRPSMLSRDSTRTNSFLNSADLCETAGAIVPRNVRVSPRFAAGNSSTTPAPAEPRTAASGPFPNPKSTPIAETGVSGPSIRCLRRCQRCLGSSERSVHSHVRCNPNRTRRCALITSSPTVREPAHRVYANAAALSEFSLKSECRSSKETGRRPTCPPPGNGTRRAGATAAAAKPGVRERYVYCT